MDRGFSTGHAIEYSIILFDADGTLFDYDKAEAFALEKSFSIFGIDFSFEFLLKYRTINSAKWALLEKGEISKDVLLTSRFSELFSEINTPDISADEFNNIYLNCLAEGAQLIDGAFEVCRDLSRSKTLAIITNGVERTFLNRLGKSAIKQYISDVFVSERIGYSKPAKEYFDYVFEKMGLKDKSSVLIVGDSLTADIQGGLNYGLDTCWYNPKGTENKSGIEPTYEINALSELITCVWH